MKPSLESLLGESLNNLKDLNAAPQATADHGPVEGLSLISADQIKEDVIAHITDEKAAIENGAYELDIPALIEQNEVDHARLRNEIGEVRDMVSAVYQSMEMLSTVCSMESIDEGSVEIANVAMDNISVLTNQPNVPTFVVEDGKLTSASMEGVADFIMDTLRKMKRWIKEKYENFVMAWRRGVKTDQLTRARIEALFKRLDSIPDDHGIPVKQMRYNADLIGYLYRDGKPIEFTAEGLSAAQKEALDYTSWANKNIAADGCKRSLHLSDNIGKILMVSDGVQAEQELKAVFKAVLDKNPLEGFLTYGKEITGGVTFTDPRLAAPRPSRDVEWIAQLADYIAIPFGTHRMRRSGGFNSKVNTLAELKAAAQVAADVLESEAYNDENWYNEISGAWNSAYSMYDRMLTTVNGVSLPHLNNELWRALDVASSAMFVLAERAFYQSLFVRSPSYRLIQGLVYVCEEQGKAYVAVNR